MGYPDLRLPGRIPGSLIMAIVWYAYTEAEPGSERYIWPGLLTPKSREAFNIGRREVKADLAEETTGSQLLVLLVIYGSTFYLLLTAGSKGRWLACNARDGPGPQGASVL